MNHSLRQVLLWDQSENRTNKLETVKNTIIIIYPSLTCSFWGSTHFKMAITANQPHGQQNKWNDFILSSRAEVIFWTGKCFKISNTFTKDLILLITQWNKTLFIQVDAEEMPSSALVTRRFKYSLRKVQKAYIFVFLMFWLLWHIWLNSSERFIEEDYIQKNILVHEICFVSDLTAG